MSILVYPDVPVNKVVKLSRLFRIYLQDKNYFFKRSAINL